MEAPPTAETKVEASVTKPPEQKTVMDPEAIAALKINVAAALTHEVASLEQSPTAALQARVVRLEATVAKFSTMQSEGAKALLATRQAELAEAKAKLSALTGGAEVVPAAVAEKAPVAANTEAAPSESDAVLKQAEQALQQLSGDASLALDQEFKSRQRLFKGAKTSEEKIKFAKHLLSFAQERATQKQSTEKTLASADDTTKKARVTETPVPASAEDEKDATTREKRMRINSLKAGLDAVDIEVYAQRKQLMEKIAATNQSTLPDSLKYWTGKTGKGDNLADANFMTEAEAYLKNPPKAATENLKRAA